MERLSVVRPAAAGAALLLVLLLVLQQSSDRHASLASLASLASVASTVTATMMLRGRVAWDGPTRRALAAQWDEASSVSLTSKECHDRLFRMQCIASTHPVFDDDSCDAWSCVPFTSLRHRHASCCMQPLNRISTLSLLNDSTVFFIGDSTARRGATQLSDFLKGREFQDIPSHATLVHKVHMDASAPVDGRVLSAPVATMVVSFWAPYLEDVVPVLLPLLQGNTSLSTYKGVLNRKRRVFVLSVSTHHLVMILNSSKGPLVLNGSDPAWPNQWAYAQTNVVEHLLGYMDPDTDVLIVRLPIAQACKAQWTDSCNHEEGVDPVNDLVDAMAARLEHHLRTRFPLRVGVLHVAKWTRAPQGGTGRHNCTAADKGGTHFDGTVARMAYVQQVLHATALMVEDMAAWRESEWWQQQQRAWALAAAEDSSNDEPKPGVAEPDSPTCNFVA